MRLALVFGCVVDGRCMTLVELRVDCTTDSVRSVLMFWLVSFVFVLVGGSTVLRDLTSSEVVLVGRNCDGHSSKTCENPNKSCKSLTY